MKNILLIILILLPSIAFSSCRTEDHEKDFVETNNCQTTILLSFNTDLEEDNNSTSLHPITKTQSFMRFILEIWELDANQFPKRCIKREEAINKTFHEGYNTYQLNLELPSKLIAVVCWAEPLPFDLMTNPHFDTTNLLNVLLIENSNDINLKDAFTASLICDYRKYKNQQLPIRLKEHITLSRPFGSYSLIANIPLDQLNQESFKSKIPQKIEIDYDLWIPTAYNAFYQTPIHPQTQKKQSFEVKMINNSQLLLADDRIFIGTQDTKETFLYFKANYYSDHQKVIKRTNQIEARIKRNRRTVLFDGDFINDLINYTGIDDRFDDELEVNLP